MAIAASRTRLVLASGWEGKSGVDNESRTFTPYFCVIAGNTFSAGTDSCP